VEVWRGLPILVTIFLVYYALPTTPWIHHRFGAFTGAGIGLTLWGSAQVAEATRGAVKSIPREQHEAAAALGFGWVGRHVSVIVPQALRRLLPPLVSLLANVIQNTTIASLVGVTELLATGQRSIERLQFEAGANSHAFAIYAGLMAAFFCISFPLTRLAIFLERRLV
jgi:polar amino acid transport system permease protein